jgi:uncharacterized membrane protein YfhO
VLADSYYPGWTVHVNGKDEIIRRANLFFRAVALPAGQHTVEFQYAPMSFKVGLIVSLATIICLCLVTGFIGFGRCKETEPSPGS